MKLTFMGTAAGEGYPGLWCGCEHCDYARRTGGRNIRANSCAVVDEDIMLDMNCECFGTANRLGMDLRSTRYLLVTHAHQDHFIPQHLVWRLLPQGYETLSREESLARSAPRFTPLPQMHIIGNAHVWEAIARHQEIHSHLADGYDMDFTLTQPGRPICFGDLTVVPVRSIHGPVKGFANNYILQREGKTLLYALDTGGYDEEMLAVLKQYRYDGIVMEGTYGHATHTFPTHMGARQNVQWRDWFAREGLLNPGCRFMLSHMSPHWTPPHDLYAPEMNKKGMDVAYDGQSIII